MADHHPQRSPIGSGLRCRCPRCGEGKLFSGFLAVAKTCSVCGLDLSKQDAGDGPAVFIIFILGFLVVPLALLLEAKVEPPIWLHYVLWPPIIVGGALWLLRPTKGLMVALQYKHKASDGGSVDYE